MSKQRRCRQCGEFRDLEEYREYYNRKGSRYRTCKICERFNNRYKYLMRKEQLTPEMQNEVHMIEKLYEVQKKLGLTPPDVTKNNIADEVEDLLRKQEEELTQLEEHREHEVEAPQELQHWLEADLEGMTELQIEQVQDDLLAKFKKQTGVEPGTFRPIYDETHKQLLNQVLERLDDYVDNL